MTALRRIGMALFAPVLAVVVALVISSLVMAALQVNPFRVFAVMLDFGETPAQQVTAIVVIVNRAIPLFLAGLAVAVAFRMGLFNIGVEGQYRLATIVAAAVGAAVALPGPLHILLISADLDELIGLSDTLQVMLRGRLVATLDPASVTPEDLGGYMTGAHTAAGAA